jgi:hypothetical protein
MFSGQENKPLDFLGNPGKNNIIFLCEIGQNQEEKYPLFWANLYRIGYKNTFLNQKIAFFGQIIP